MTTPSRPPQTAHTLRSVARPKQARSERTLQRLLDAAESLIEEKGLGAVSIPEIVHRAGSSVGGFYARFRDKNELLRALEERFLRELDERVEEMSSPGRWTDVPTRDVVEALVVELVRTVREREALIGMFFFRAGSDPDAFEHGVRFRNRISTRVCDLLIERPEIRHPEPSVAIDLGVQMALGLIHQSVVFGELRAGQRRLSDKDVIQEITRSFLAYVGVDPGYGRGQSNQAP
jgi:AcrR family transcriptional regulator